MALNLLQSLRNNGFIPVFLKHEDEHIARELNLAEPSLCNQMQISSTKTMGNQQSRVLAGRALSRAVISGKYPRDAKILGLGVVSEPGDGDLVPKTAFITIWSPFQVYSTSIAFHPKARTETEEISTLDTLITHALGSFCCVGEDLLKPLDIFSVQPHHYDISFVDQDSISNAIQSIVDGAVDFFRIDKSGLIDYRCPVDQHNVLVGGSFNPVHIGHTELLKVACDLVRPRDGSIVMYPAFEIAVVNPDKGKVDSLMHKVAQFAGYYNVIVTSAPTFTQKSRIIPNSTFVVGIDTAIRIVMPKYYGDSEEGLSAALQTLKDNNCDFLVAGRMNPADNTFQSLKDLKYTAGSEPHKELFVEIPEQVFRYDISSTEIRAKTPQL